MRKFLAVIIMSWQDALNHRARIIVWASIDLILPVVMVLLFRVIYPTPTSLINGLSYSDLVRYYLLITFLKVLIISYPNENVSEGIWRGSLSKYLVKPIAYPLHQLMGEFGWRQAAALIFLPVVIIISLILKLPLISQPTLTKFFVFFVALFFTFLVYWLFDFIFGLTAFWFTDISGITNLKHVFFTLLSGQLVPPQFLPQSLQQINHWLPFQYIMAFPVKILQGNLSLSSISFALGLLIAYGLIFSIFAFWLWKKGLKQYSAVGL